MDRRGGILISFNIVDLKHTGMNIPARRYWDSRSSYLYLYVEQYIRTSEYHVRINEYACRNKLASQMKLEENDQRD